MELQNLTAFIAVSELESFSRAAEQLHLTQPAVSKRISALEETLATPLFDRIGRRVQLTQAGQALLPSAQRILAELEESRRAIANLNQQVSGRLKLATSHHIGLHRLPPVLRAYTSQFPEVDLDIHFMDSEEACSAVLRGDVEIAIATLPDQQWPQLRSDIIWHDPLGIVVSTQHPEASHASIRVEQLRHLPAILPSKNTFTRTLLEQALGLNEQNMNIGMETNYLETIKMMVSIGLGWSVLPLSMLNEDIHHLAVDGIQFERLLGVVTHQQRTLSNAARKMLLELEKQSATPGHEIRDES